MTIEGGSGDSLNTFFQLLEMVVMVVSSLSFHVVHFSTNVVKMKVTVTLTLIALAI